MHDKDKNSKIMPAYSFVLALGIAIGFIIGRCAYAGCVAAPAIPPRDYQRDFAAFPSKEYIYTAVPEEAPFRVNEYTFFATVVDRSGTGKGFLIDVVFYAYDIKHTPYMKNMHIILTNSHNQAFYDGDIMPDFSNTYRLRLEMAVPEKCKAVLKFRDAAWDYQGEFDLQLGSPEINYIILFLDAFAVTGAFVFVVLAKMSRYFSPERC